MGPGDAGAPSDLDLDALIGDIRREAARRRAAPDFPLDEEARLAVEMDQQGPAGAGGADLAAVTAELRRIEGEGEGRLAELAGLAASAVTALSIRLTDAERRAATATATAAATAAAAPAAPPQHPSASQAAGPDLASEWIADVTAAAAAAPTGRVLVAGEHAATWVERLHAAGVDAYGLDPADPADEDHGPVRAGPLLPHLRTVGDAGLALAVLVGPTAAEEAQRLAEVAAEVARTSARVAVCAEAPWAWRSRVGDAAADTSGSHPIGPEAWLAALSRAGFTATAHYSQGGRSFLVDGIAEGKG